jgi:prenyltransferase beta subunit
MISALIPYSLAKQRKSYLTDFIISTRIEQSGFSNSQESTSFSYEATTDALSILKHYELYEVPGAWGSVIDNVNVTLFQNSLSQKITPLVDSSGAIIYELYNLYNALDLIDYLLSSSIKTRTAGYLEATNQTSGGFAPTNISISASLISSYYVIQLYSMIGKLNQINKNLHKEWVLNCSNSDGGFGGNSSLPSTIMNTYLGLLTLNTLGSLNELPNPAKTIGYLNSFYISDQSDLNNFGGYLPDNYTSIALLSSTYYSTKAISLLDNTQLNSETTVNWVLNRQNFEDGGFTENSDGAEQKVSSVISSYFAFEILKIFQAELQMLNEDIWMVEFSWFILLIVLSGIGIMFGIILVIWRKRRI